MKKLKIENKKNYEYILKDEYGEEYNLNLEFMDIEYNLHVGDYIYMNNELLNPKYEGFSTSYTFGNLDSKYGKSNILKDDIDIIKIVVGEIEIYLKRLYG